MELAAGRSFKTLQPHTRPVGSWPYAGLIGLKEPGRAGYTGESGQTGICEGETEERKCGVGRVARLGMPA